VAQSVVKTGAHIINDISGGQYDAAMFSTIASLNVPYVVMHINESKDEMHHVKNEASILPVLHDFFTSTCATAKDAGIQQLILDPGFGFSKSPTQNFELISNLSTLATFQKPILIGVSRKSTIYKTLGITAADALNGTTVLHTAALLHGASILRVHDVKEAKEVVTLCSYLQ
jgi:dihydropteroate synthase